MWKRDETPDPIAPARPAAPAPTPERAAPARTSAGERATIGRSITIRGEVTGDEDLLIQGRIDGSVNLRQHSITIGPEGEVKADVIGRVVTVEGNVEGNVSAEEQVILRSSAQVQGDITAPRVVLEDGARFRGGVDMGESFGRGNRPATSRDATAREAGNQRSAAAEVLAPTSAASETSVVADKAKGGAQTAQAAR